MYEGCVCMDLGNFEEAIKFFNKVLEINPYHEGAIDNKINVLSEINKKCTLRT